MHLVTDVRPALATEDVLRGQGIDPGRARPAVVEAARQVVDEAQALLAPASVYDLVSVLDFAHETIALQGGTFEGPLVARALAGAAELALAVCTIGPALDARVAELFAGGDALRAVALDGAGIAAVGQVGQAVRERICDEAGARGWKTGMRASPGQEGWPIEQQRVLFDLLPADRIGVGLTESCLMLPRKSVSFAVGLGPEMRADAVTCDFCSKRERCNWSRRVGGAGPHGQLQNQYCSGLCKERVVFWVWRGALHPATPKKQLFPSIKSSVNQGGGWF